MADHPRILFVSPCWPHGRTFGGQLRALHTACALQHVGNVTVLVVGSDAGDAKSRELTMRDFRIEPPMHAMVTAKRQVWDHLRWAMNPRYLNLHGYTTSGTDRNRMRDYFRQYDLIWVLNARTPSLLQLWHWPHTHLDIDDLPSVTVRNLASVGSVAILKSRLRRRILHSREKQYPRRFTTLSVCSESDRKYLELERVHLIPNGFPRPTVPPMRAPSATHPRIGFIGLYSHGPNAEGMTWFLRDVWPIVRAAVPGIRFRLVGSDTDGPLRPTSPEVDALGWMADPGPEIATWSAMVVPIWSGGGTRIKVADGLSRKCPLISTRHGVHGYDVTDGEQLCVADDASSFARSCIRLVQNPDEASAMAERGWNAFLEKWTWDAIAPRVWSAAEDCLQRSGQCRSRPVAPADASCLPS